MRILKKYISKKNKVFLICEEKNKIIYKEFFDSHRLIQEYSCLKNLEISSSNVPKIIRKEDNILFLEYIEGQNLSDYIDENINEDVYIIDRLIKHLMSLYNTKFFKDNKFILNDVNLRNFIINKDKIYSVDLEDVKKGNIENDIVGVLIFLLTNNPSFSDRKIKMAQRFYIGIKNNVELNKEKLNSSVDSWIKRLENRRKIEFSNNEKRLIKDLINMG